MKVLPGRRSSLPSRSPPGRRLAWESERAGGPRGGGATVLGRLARSRLLHFLVIGGLIFWFAPRPDPGRDIAFDSATFIALEAAQTTRLGRAVLAPRDAADVRTRAIEDEILYREALRLGFDRNDNVVRQRLIQKVLFLAEDLAGVSRPATEAELRAFFAATRSQWTRPARLRLIQVYAGSERRDWLAGVRDDVVAAEAAAPGEPPPLGDAFALPRAATLTREELARHYGEGFATAAFGLAPGQWSEPIPSTFGWHLVKILERQEERPAEFEDVQAKLPLVHLVARKQHATRDFLRTAAERYRITIDGRPLTALPPSDRAPPDPVEEPD